jgi:hypothetical protein
MLDSPAAHPRNAQSDSPSTSRRIARKHAYGRHQFDNPRKTPGWDCGLLKDLSNSQSSHTWLVTAFVEIAFDFVIGGVLSGLERRGASRETDDYP